MKPMVMLVKPGRVVFLFFCLRFEQACPSSHAETERENPSNSRRKSIILTTTNTVDQQVPTGTSNEEDSKRWKQKSLKVC